LATKGADHFFNAAFHEPTRYAALERLCAIQSRRPRLRSGTIGLFVQHRIRKVLERKDRPGFLKIAKELGVGTSTVQRIAAEVRG
jgi:hypothetical protein